MEKPREPGTARFGSFINYYSFNPVQRRLDLIPHDILLKDIDFDKERPFLMLDIGCNCGDLTLGLKKHLEPGLCDLELKILGVDLDPVLIERSRSLCDPNVTFSVVDVMNIEDRSKVSDWLKSHDRLTFDLVTCFSVTLWVHINHNDEGLRGFLTYISSLANHLILELQPWKCYKTAVRRMKRSACEDYPEFHSLQWRENVDTEICRYLTESCNMALVKTYGETAWERKLLLFKQTL